MKNVVMIKIDTTCARLVIKKIVCGTKTLEFFSISLKYETLIRQHINDNFSLSDRKFPLSICNSC